MTPATDHNPAMRPGDAGINALHIFDYCLSLKICTEGGSISYLPYNH
jgi:hypothetical protein